MTQESTLLAMAEPEIIADALIDTLMETVVLPLDARARSAAIRSLMVEITTAVAWLRERGRPDDDATAAELVSLRQLAIAAQDHERRMVALADPAATGLRGAPGRGRRTPWLGGMTRPAEATTPNCSFRSARLGRPSRHSRMPRRSVPAALSAAFAWSGRCWPESTMASGAD